MRHSTRDTTLVAERWILARLRNQHFFNLTELNRAIADLLTDLNARLFKKLPSSRKSCFDAMDHPALHALLLNRYQYAE